MDLFYKIGDKATFKRSFKHNHRIYDEYIHCIIEEWFDNWDGTPRRIRVSQIHNLEEYYSNPEYNNFTERILRTSELESIFPYNRI